jgi:hypothetical protein
MFVRAGFSPGFSPVAFFWMISEVFARTIMIAALIFSITPTYIFCYITTTFLMIDIARESSLFTTGWAPVTGRWSTVFFELKPV